LGEATQNIKLLDAAERELAAITGQKPLITKSKKAIAGFKLKQGVPLGCKVTLRGDRMFEFLDRLISVALPRIRDFRGLSTKSFDGKGNYSFGLKEQFIFPEIDYDKVEMVHGLDITICTSAQNDEQCKVLLRHMGMPFRR
jgi:large subunit ribosomal protein L5